MAHVARISREFRVHVDVIVTRKGDDVASLAARAASENRQPVVAGGGDGTVNAVAGALAGRAVPLGVLPMGTLNHFAKDVGIPRALEAAVRNIFTGRVTHVDVGQVNGRVFVNNSGIGFYPRFVRQREDLERHGRVKRVAFALTVRSLVHSYFRLRIKMHMSQADALEQVTPFLFVGNNRYQTSGLKAGTRTRLDSGRLWVCTSPRDHRYGLARTALRALAGRDTDQALNAFETSEFSVQLESARVDVSTDGEVSATATPLHFGLRPRALPVIVPAAE
jgi:diacylglycerol kinase family enzyme